MFIEALLHRIGLEIASGGLAPASLDRVAGELREATKARSFWLERYRPATESEELVYEIACEPKSGVALYLVSDAPRTKSPPHTWKRPLLLLRANSI